MCSSPARLSLGRVQVLRACASCMGTNVVVNALMEQQHPRAVHIQVVVTRLPHSVGGSGGGSGGQGAWSGGMRGGTAGER